MVFFQPKQAGHLFFTEPTEQVILWTNSKMLTCKHYYIIGGMIKCKSHVLLRGADASNQTIGWTEQFQFENDINGYF